MPPSPEKDEDDAPSPISAAKRKASLANNTPPRRAAANKRTPSTPIRKTSGNAVKTPNTAPARAKKGEPTLLGDFLLGRPTPARQQQQRRKSLDAVKTELKAANVGSIKVPGGVKDRVKQWQKANAAAVVAEAVSHEKNEDEGKSAQKQKSKSSETLEQLAVNDDDRLKVKPRAAKRPGRRKSKEEVQDDNVSEAHSRSTSAPRKRVVSDEHWKKDRAPKKKSPRSASQKIPKDFLTKTVVKEPVGNRVQEWMKISEAHSGPESDHGEINRPLRHELKFPKEPLDDGIRVRPLRGSSKSPVKDDGIRIKPRDDSPEIIVEEEIRVKPIRREGQKRRPKVIEEVQEESEVEEEVATPTQRPEKRLKAPAGHTGKLRATSSASRNILEEDDEVNALTPSPSTQAKRKPRQSDTPSELSEIPFGNSAFSVLELPLGAEAGTMPSKRPPPKRTPSFGVPKVLKKVYNAVHEASEPPRGGPNQPASIESWLNGTSDPFVDRPTPPQSVVAGSEVTPSRSTSYSKDVDKVEPEKGDEGSSTPRRLSEKRAKGTLDSSPQEVSTPALKVTTRDSLPSMERTTPLSPGTLKRSSATRNTSSPKAGRKLTLKETIFDAFKGESAMAGQKGPNPFTEITASREKKEVHRSPSYGREPVYEEKVDISDQETNLEPIIQEPQRSWQRPLPPLFRGPPPVGGGHRLSTIASVETFSTSTATDTASEVSQTTITQDTVLSATTVSSLSRKSNNKPSKPGLKRRLTKHSDLMSVLSLPDAAQPGRATSIRSARSVRTTRTKLETATVRDIMREVAEDETKYMRELKTLVDGVIPVLLTCVLSKSDSAKAAGLFNPNYISGNDPTFTKPIVDMGVALERLKSLHRRIPLESPDAFITWAGQAHRSYHDYVVAWRTGFQDVVVNLAPSSRTPSGEKSTLDELPRNAAGDVVGANGERVDVAHLMKRPLVRTKYINKAIKGLIKFDPACERKVKASETWGDLEAFVRKRAKEEEARRVDQAANSTDATRARDPRTFAPADNVRIDQGRQVYAQDLFSFDISHSNGQQMSCQVEILIRDKASDPKDCDILICEVDSIRRFLLFPPLSKDKVSARMGDNKNELVVMIRGVHDASEWSEEWSEVFVLENDEEEVISEWLEMLGTVPTPPAVVRKPVDIDDILSEISESIVSMQEPLSPIADGDVPVGERRRREAEESPRNSRPPSSHSRGLSTPTTSKHNQSEVSDHVSDRIVDLNDAMSKAGTLTPKRPRAARYHGKSKSVSTPETFMMSGGLNPYAEVDTEPKTPKAVDNANELPYVPNLRARSLPSTPEREAASTPLKESMRPEAEMLKKQQRADDSRDDEPPPPPPHRTPTPSSLKSTPVLDSGTVKIKRRSSSPLKHEYQPSDASDTTEDELFYSDSDSYTESSDEDDLEAVEMPSVPAGPNTYGTKRISPSGSMYSIPNSTLAPSNSASQAPYRGVPVQKPAATSRKNMASISAWDNRHGKWVDLHKEPCSIAVTPGLIQAFEMSAAHSSPNPNQSMEDQSTQVTPLLAQVVTPMVPLRQSNALDIEIRVKPNAGTAIKKSPDYVTIRYRAATTNEASMLYLALHRARLENPVWLKLEEERRVNCFGTNNFRQQDKRSSWAFFKRRKSYRASARAPSVAPTEESGRSRGSSFIQRLTGGGGEYNIAKSTLHGGGPESPTYVSNPSDYSGGTPPRTPSIVNSSYSQAMLKNRGTEDLAIRLYQVHSSTKWEDMGPARLTVTLVPQGMRQASSLNHGIERRIIVTRKVTSSFFDSLANNFTDKAKNQGEYYTFIDMVLGADCFSIIGRTGVCATVWEDVMGPNGEIGMVGATGGVAGRTRRWLFQTSCQADAAHIYNICAIGGRNI